MVIIRKTDNTKCLWWYGETGTLIHFRWEYRMVHPLWKTVYQFLKKWNEERMCVYVCVCVCVCVCMCVCVCVCVCVCAQSLQWCLTLCDPVDCSPPGFSVHGVLQAIPPEWVALPLSRGSSWPRDRTQTSWIAGEFFTIEPPGKPGELPYDHVIPFLVTYPRIWKYMPTQKSFIGIFITALLIITRK